MVLYVHRNRRLIRGRETQDVHLDFHTAPELSDIVDDNVELNVLGCRVDILGTNCDQCRSMVQCCFMSTETVRPIKDGEPRTATSTFTQAPELWFIVSSERLYKVCTEFDFGKIWARAQSLARNGHPSMW